MTCDPTCIDSLPNSCGLPVQLADFAITQQPPAKKPRKQKTKDTVQEEVDTSTDSTRPDKQPKKRQQKGRTKKARSEAEALETSTQPVTSQEELHSVRKTRSRGRESEGQAHLPPTKTQVKPDKTHSKVKPPSGTKKVRRTPPKRAALAQFTAEQQDECLLGEIQASADILKTGKVYMPK